MHRTYEYGGCDYDVCDLESRWKMIILQLATCSRARLGFFVPIRCHSRFCPTCGVKYSQERSASMSFKLVNCMPTIDMVATGRNIMRLREAAGLTVRDLQDIFGFATPQAIYKWQHGTAIPTIDNLVVLAAVMDVPMDEIIVIDVNRTKQISA